MKDYHMKLVVERLVDYENKTFEKSRLGNPNITHREAIQLANYIQGLKVAIIGMGTEISQLRKLKAEVSPEGDNLPVVSAEDIASAYIGYALSKYPVDTPI